MTWLIESGFLSPYRAFTAPKQIDLQGVHTRMGDYVGSELRLKGLSAESAGMPELLSGLKNHDYDARWDAQTLVIQANSKGATP